MQTKDANPLQRALAGNVRTTQTLMDGELRNFSFLAPGVSVRTLGQCSTATKERTSVELKDVWLQLGPLK